MISWRNKLVSFVAVAAAYGGAQAAQTPVLKTTVAIGPATSAAQTQAPAEVPDGALWLRAGDASRAVALIETLEAAGSHGLPPQIYRTTLLRTALDAAATGDAERVAAAERLLTEAYLAYAEDVSSGLLRPRQIDRDLHVFPERPDPEFLKARIQRSADVAQSLAELAPAHPHYEALRAKNVALSERGSWGAPGAAEGRSLRLDDRGPRVAAMRERLVALGDLASDTPAIEPELFDEPLEAAVRAFQRRHGLNDDGVAGRRTLAAMNASVEDRLRQVVVNLERLRWLNRDLGRRHIMVNQADFRVQVVDGGDVLFDERVVIGKARKHRTPEFSDTMTYLVLNPTWHIPRSIATKEILPKLQEDPTYLTRQNMRLQVKDGAAPDPELTDWSLYSENDFPFRIKQRPGSGNALGKVKFMFPNEFNIYLHDTPSKRLFKKDARAFSHGCVRVQDPLRLAHVLLAPQSENPEALVTRILDRGKERVVELDSPVPVHLTYRTAWVDEDGVRHFRDDIYGRDARVFAALKAEGVSIDVLN